MRHHFSEVVDRVESQHERVIVTRNGEPAAVIISSEDLAELEKGCDVTDRRPRRNVRAQTLSSAVREARLLATVRV